MNTDILSRMPRVRKSKSTGQWYLRDRSTGEIIPGTVGDRFHATEAWVAYGMLAGEYSVIDLRGLESHESQVSESYGHNSWNGKGNTRNISYPDSPSAVPIMIRLAQPGDSVDIWPMYVHVQKEIGGTK